MDDKRAFDFQMFIYENMNKAFTEYKIVIDELMKKVIAKTF